MKYLVETLKHPEPYWQWRHNILQYHRIFAYMKHYIYIYIYSVCDWSLMHMSLWHPEITAVGHAGWVAMAIRASGKSTAHWSWRASKGGGTLRSTSRIIPSPTLTLFTWFLKSIFRMFFCHLVFTLKFSCQSLVSLVFVSRSKRIPNWEFKRLGSWIWGAVATSCWALEAIHSLAGHVGSWTCQYSFLYQNSVQDILHTYIIFLHIYILTGI